MTTLRTIIQGRRVEVDVPADWPDGAEVEIHPVAEGANGANASLTQSKEFVQRAVRLDEKGHTDAALDLIYDSVDELMRKGEFPQLDSMLSKVEPASLSADILLGILTATLPARSRLAARRDLFRKAESVLKARSDWQEGLLVGLEG
jgi:hypothetical protein